MKLYYVKIIETLAVIIIYIILKDICFKIIDKTVVKRFLQEARGIITKRFINIIFLSISVAVTLLVWGVKQADLAIFIGSVLTVVGVAFFAQWSILSNVTSSIIIFFNHPIKINDSIVILEAKDYVIEGKVTNIGLFFVTLHTDDSEEITLPNNIFIQKSIKKIINRTEKDEELE